MTVGPTRYRAFDMQNKTLYSMDTSGTYIVVSGSNFVAGADGTYGYFSSSGADTYHEVVLSEGDTIVKIAISSNYGRTIMYFG